MIGRLKFDIKNLVNEMLDHLPQQVWTSKTTRFLDTCMGGGQFVAEIERRLLSAGHSKKNVAKRVFGCETNVLRVNYAKNRLSLVGQYAVANALEKDWGTMKFDVVIGNPPYVDSSVGKIPIYDKFVNQAIDLSTQFVALVIPSGFATSDERNGDVVRKIVSSPTTSVIKFLDLDSFPGAIVNTLYFLVDKHQTGKTCIQSGVKAYDVVAKPGDYIFRHELLRNILIKCGTYNASESWIKFNRIENVTPSTTEIKTVSQISRTTISYDMMSCADAYVNTHKVVTSLLPNALHHLDVVWHVPPGVGVKKGYTVYKAASEQEAVNLAQYLRSSLCRVIHSETKTSRSLRTPQLKFIPRVDLTKSWADADLYKHFKLTPEEIAYIESHV